MLLKCQWLCKYVEIQMALIKVLQQLKSSMTSGMVLAMLSLVCPMSFLILEGCYKILHKKIILNPFLDTDSSSSCWKLLEVSNFYILSSIMICYFATFIHTKGRTRPFLWFSLSHSACFGEWKTCN